MLRIAINGYGRIGRSVLRALYESGARNTVQVVAINELSDSKTIAHLTRYDSTHGRFPGIVTDHDDSLCINGDTIAIFHEKQWSNLPWHALAVDVVLECSGSYTDPALVVAAVDAATTVATRTAAAAATDATDTVAAAVTDGTDDDAGDDTDIATPSATTSTVVTATTPTTSG